MSRREKAKAELHNSAISTAKKVSIIRDYVFGGLSSLYYNLMGRLGVGVAGRDYIQLERKILKVLRSSKYSGDRFSIGQYSYLLLALSRAPQSMMYPFLFCLPTVPAASGPELPLPPKSLGTPREKTSTSASSSDHEGNDDLASSIHTGTSASSKVEAGYESSASGTGLDGSWVGLDGSN